MLINIFLGKVLLLKCECVISMKSGATIGASIINDLTVVNATKCQTRHVGTAVVRYRIT